ncbi:MAG: 50S ribosomal protein L18 [Patescibacteria group bacterium]
MSLHTEKTERAIRRKRRVRARVSGIAARPRISVFRSHRHFYGQIIDDEKGITIASARDSDLPNETKTAPGKTDIAGRVGALLAQKAGGKGIIKATFDRGAYRYAGLVRAFADGARKGGLEF